MSDAGRPQRVVRGRQVLYVGADRFANNGDSGLGFMFLQSGLAGNTCPAPSTNCTFNNGQGGTPHHTNGDIYVVSQFTGGGQGVTVDFYVWAGATPATGSSTPRVWTATPPLRTTLPARTVFGDGDRKTNTCEDSPWTFITKFPGDAPCTASDFAEGTFFEGGVNLTQRNITGCFKTILVDTSQPQNINEAAQDFVFAPFEGCTSGIVTTPQAGRWHLGSKLDWDGRTRPCEGSRRYHGERDSHLRRDREVLPVRSIGLDTGRTAPPAVSRSGCGSGETVTGANFTAAVNSDDVTLTSAGRYCWRADTPAIPLGKSRGRTILEVGGRRWHHVGVLQACSGDPGAHHLRGRRCGPGEPDQR